MPTPCDLCGKREASAGTPCPVCHHTVSTGVCVACHIAFNHQRVATDLLERAQVGRDENGLLVHGDSNGR